ncbi:MAG: DNA translocase FtsK [Flavobacteriaceae bacterium]
MAAKSTKAKADLSPKKIFAISRKNRIIIGFFTIVLAIAFAIALISFLSTWKEDQSILGDWMNRSTVAQNTLNKFGAVVAYYVLYQGFGVSSFIFGYLLGISGWALMFTAKRFSLWSQWFWGLYLVIFLSVGFGFLFASAPLWGGVVGYEMNLLLRDYVGSTGVGLILLCAFMIFAVRVLQFDPEKIQLATWFARFKNNKNSISSTEIPVESEEDEISVPLIPVDPIESNLNEESPQVDVLDESEEESEEQTFLAESSLQVPLSWKPATEATTLHESNMEPNPEGDVPIELNEITQETEETDNLAAQIRDQFGDFDPTLELSNYQFPPIELLAAHGSSGSITINEEELEENKNKIVDTLKNYSIGIAQIKATIGPTVTLYEIVPEAGIRISKIKNLEDDIALSLSALGIRIIAPIPGKGTIGIEVPNKNPSVVSMRSVIASTKFQKAEMELPIAFGKTISNETFVVDLAKMPHMLMAGATGQGKSVGLNAVLASLLYKKHPAEVKFVLVDPKKVELTLYNKIERHFLAKLPDSADAIITDNTKVIHTLNSLCIEMDQRYELLKLAMVRNIKEYNEKFKSRRLNPNDGHQFLPYIVLVIDEFADLIMTAGKEVETPIARLAQLARAIGIHLIIATQRPSVNVITGIIKANFPARLAFRVTSKIDSRTILDTQGADQLIGRGDMLFTQGNDVTRIQCAFVDTPEIQKLTEFIGSQRGYAQAHLLPEYVGEESSLDMSDLGERDPLFREAAEVLVIAQQGSASLIQRKLKLGYNRAGRLIDQLEAAGIVGPFEGSKARQVLIRDMQALEQFFNQ